MLRGAGECGPSPCDTPRGPRVHLRQLRLLSRKRQAGLLGFPEFSLLMNSVLPLSYLPFFLAWQFEKSLFCFPFSFLKVCACWVRVLGVEGYILWLGC